VLELEPASDESTEEDALPHALATAVGRIASAATFAELGSEVVRLVRDLTGYDRVMVYQFDADGHGEVIAEARDERLLNQPVSALGGDLAAQIARAAHGNLLMLPTPIRCHVEVDGRTRALQGMLHRQPRSGLVVELEPAPEAHAADEALPQALAASIGRITSATSVVAMGDEVVRCVRELTGYDRVMVYQFDPDGHGEVIAEARDERLDSFLGQRYPSSDIPQRARELYLRTRVRELADVNYVPEPIVPRHSPATGDELDMSLCYLRSMSPLHLQYLRNMGVTGTLVASLVREGKLWGLIACHHYSVKSVPYELRAACELLSEVVSTRIAALDTRAQVEAELFVRDLEHRLVSAASDTGDWRDALFDEPNAQLLRPLDASGAALFYEGELLTAGEVPTLPELRGLAAWLRANARDPNFQSSALPKANPEFASLAATATGVLVAELSRADGEYLVWFRKEQIRTVTWAGNPEKPVVVGNDPRDLSPRRSFAAWKELVRETAKPWTPTELAIAAAVRLSLVDMILQMRALRALIAERQATSALGVIQSGAEPMILADGEGQILIVNDAFHRLLERPMAPLARLDDLLLLAADQSQVREALHRVNTDRQPWRGEVRLSRGAGRELPVAVRADPVPGLRGDVLGYILIFTDLREQREAVAIRARLERAIAESHVEAPRGGVAAVVCQDFDRLLSAILANATAAMRQIPDGSVESSAGPLLRELEAATRRAADLTTQLLGTVSGARRASGDLSTGSRPAP
jgi:PAS domain S-box-containing protein